MKIIKKYSLLSFFILTITLSWILWIPLLSFFNLQFQLTTLLIIIGGFSPFLSAIIITLLTEGKKELKNWLKTIFQFRIKLITYCFAIVYPVVYIAASYGLYLAFEGITVDFSQIPSIILYPIGVIFVFFFGGGQEEPGWRGFALKKLLRPYSPFLSSILIGIVWAIWHLPLFFIEGSSQANIPFSWYFPNIIGMSIIFTMLYLRSNKSLAPSMVLHGGLNTAIGWLPIQESILPPYAYITIAGWIFILIFIVFFQGNLFLTKQYK